MGWSWSWGASWAGLGEYHGTRLASSLLLVAFCLGVGTPSLWGKAGLWGLSTIPPGFQGGVNARGPLARNFATAIFCPIRLGNNFAWDPFDELSTNSLRSLGALRLDWYPLSLLLAELWCGFVLCISDIFYLGGGMWCIGVLINSGVVFRGGPACS